MIRARHLSTDVLNLFYRGELEPSENRRVVRHLLSGCADCKQRSTNLWSTLGPNRGSAEEDRTGFNGVFSRASASAFEIATRIKEERLAAQGLADKFLAHPVERQRILATNSRKFRNYGFCEYLVEVAFESGFNDATLAAHQAELAKEIACRLSPSEYGERVIRDLQARAVGTLGNALRIRSELDGALSSILSGLELLEEGTGDLVEKARLLSFLATLRTDQRSFDEATLIYDQIIEIHEELGDDHMVGRTLGQKAYVYRRKGDYLEAIPLSRAALQRLDVEREPRDVLVARHGLCHSLVSAAMLDEASQELQQVTNAYRETGNELDVLRCEWLEAQILLDREQFHEAESLYRHVRDSLIKQAIPYDAALANLDLAESLLHQRKLGEMRELLSEAIPIFQNLGIHREAIAAMTFLQQSIEPQKVTVALIKATAQFIEESKKNPGMKFRPGASEDT